MEAGKCTENHMHTKYQAQTAETKDKEKILKATREKRYTKKNNNKIDSFHSLC